MFVRNLLTAPLGEHFYHTLGVLPQPGRPRESLQKTSNFKPALKTLKHQKKSEPKVTQSHQNVTHRPPSGHQISEYVEFKPSLSDPNASIGCPLDPWITKMGSRVPKMEPQGLQHDSFG